MIPFLTKEIIYYSLIPALIAFILIMIAYFASLKRKNRESIGLNYFIKAMILIMIGATLPLITGYTFWVIEIFSKHNTIIEHLPYLILIVFLSLFLLMLLIRLYFKTFSLANRPRKKRLDESIFE